MKCLADFKRAAKVGSRWITVYRGSRLGWDDGSRPVIEAKSTYIRFQNSDGKQPYFYFPKASDCDFPDEKTINIYVETLEGERKLWLTYQLAD